MVSHSTEQRHDSIWKPESTSILSCSPWRSSQSFHVPFKLERFQFLPLIADLRVHSKERFFQGMEGKWLQVILSLFSFSLLVFVCALLVCFTFKFWVSLVLCFSLFNMFLFTFSFVYFVFDIKIKNQKNLKNQKNTKTMCVCVHWYLCILDGYWNKIF